MLTACTLLLAGCSASRQAGSAPTASPRALAGNSSVRGNSNAPSPRGTSEDAAEGSENTPEKDVVEAHARYAEAIINELNDQSDLALNGYYNAAMSDPNNETLVMDVSRRFLQAKQPEKALEILLRSTSNLRASGALWARLGLTYLQLDKTDLALKANRTAIKKQPRAIAGYRNLYLTQLKLKQPQEALAALDEAAKASPTDFDFLIELGELYSNFTLQVPDQRTNAQAHGVAVLHRAAKMPVNDPQLQLRLADAFNLLGDDKAAAEIYRQLLKDLPDLPMVRENLKSKLLEIYLRGGDRTNAIEQLEATLRENPTDAQSYYILGSIVYEDKDYARAAECFSKTVLLAPEFEQAYYDLAAAQMYGDKNDEALKTLASARAKFSRNSRNFVLEYFNAMAYMRAKDFTNAITCFSAAEIIAQADRPKRLNESFYFQYASACERKGDLTQAERYFKKCLELSPNFAEAQNYLGYMWAEHGENLDRAHELITKALTAEPKNAAYLDSMAWVLFKQQKPKEALPYILDAIKNSEEEDATVYDHLGDIYSALNQPEKAREGWKKSLSLESNDEVRKKLEPAPAKETH
jgi:tetratricopeptide (TPR) repeat protein